MKFANMFKQTAVALILGLMVITTASTVQAATFYSSDVLVQLFLTGVSGGTLGTNVVATFENSTMTRNTSAIGPSWASTDPYLYPGLPVNNMAIGTSLEHQQNVLGEAYGFGGNAFSELLTNGYIHLGNASGQDVIFSFEYVIQGSAGVASTGPGFADAYGAVEIFDTNYGFAPLFEVMEVNLLGTTTALLNKTGTFSVTLPNGSSNDISALVTTYGSAEVPVPEPSTYALMLAGMGVLGVLSRREHR
jgi:hypothetical protein